MVWYRLADCNVAASVRLIKRRIMKGEEHAGWRGGKLRDDASKGGG